MSSAQPDPFRVSYQDGPPAGGYPKVEFRRRVPVNWGPKPLTWIVGSSLVLAFGVIRAGQFNVHRRQLQQEKAEARMALIPLLQAEEDRRFLIEMNRNLEEEQKIMKDVPGWKVGESVYYTKNPKRWVSPAKPIVETLV